MTPTLAHTKNPLAGWDISASAKVDKSEKITRGQIIVNGSSEFDETFDTPLSSWSKTLTQQGRYPGDNTVQLIVTDDQGNDTAAEDSWS
jgi:hypothetical protein